MMDMEKKIMDLENELKTKVSREEYMECLKLKGDTIRLADESIGNIWKEIGKKVNHKEYINTLKNTKIMISTFTFEDVMILYPVVFQNGKQVDLMNNNEITSVKWSMKYSGIMSEINDSVFGKHNRLLAINKFNGSGSTYRVAIEIKHKDGRIMKFAEITIK